MKIGIAGPIATEDVAHLLKVDTAGLPRGYIGAPLLGTLITTLVEMGHQVSVFTTDRTTDITKGPVRVAGVSGFQMFYCGCRPRSFRPNGGLPGRMVDFFRLERSALQQAMAYVAPDVVHAHWTYEFALAAISTGIPHLITCHDSPAQVLRYTPSLYRLGRYAMARMVFQRAHALTAVSAYLERELSKYTRVPIAVVPNPLPATLVARADPLAIRNPCYVTPRIGMILNGWGRRKNPKAGFKAFALLRREIPDATLHLYGFDCGAGETADIWASKHHLRDNVVFHGPVNHERLLAELGQMDVLLHPAREETMGMAIVEAMALGVPVVGGRRSGAVPWVLNHGRAGILTDVENPVAMFTSMHELLKDSEQYQHLSAYARSRALEEFSPKSVAERYLGMYHQVLDTQLPKCRATQGL